MLEPQQRRGRRRVTPAVLLSASGDEITDADLSKACSEAARVLTPKGVMEVIARFGVKNVGALNGGDRRRFLEALEAVKEGKELPPQAAPSPPSGSVRRLKEAYDGLEFDRDGNLDGGEELTFCKFHRDADVPLPVTLPSISHGDSVYFVVPADLVEDRWGGRCSPRLAAKVVAEGNAFIPREDWPPGSEIVAAINEYFRSLLDADELREAHELLERERRPDAALYGSTVEIEETAPMLVDGLIRERGVSVIYGDMDEFKTTLVLDMMAHVAAGAAWQGRQVTPRPVIWYALEDASEIPVRLRALEARLKSKATAWGSDCLPITVRDRIPEDYRNWRREIASVAYRWDQICTARATTGSMPTKTVEHPGDQPVEVPLYPFPNGEPWPVVIVIDTLSMALGGADEKGPGAVEFVNRCLDLLKERPDMAGSLTSEGDAEDQDEGLGAEHPVALHVIIIHHQTKTGAEFAGHRAIGANTQGLYRVHRFGKMDDANRPYAGMLTPRRTKGMVRPAPLRFEVAVVDVPGTKRTAAILKDRAAEVPSELKPAIEALRGLEDSEPITLAELNECLNEVEAVAGAKEGDNRRKARQRCREKLESAGVIERVEEDGKFAFYRFHDPGPL